MRRNDFILLAALAVLWLWCLAPAWWRQDQALSSFGDLYAYHYPMRHLVASSLQAGRLPFWNPYIFCGLPLSANSQAAVFYPVSLLSAFWPLSLALTWDYLLHWLWGALGIFLLARRNRLPSTASLALCCAFGFSPFLIYRVAEGIPTLLAALSWTPWAWLAFQSSIPGLLAAVWALQFLSGHPQFLVVNALGMALWAALSPGRGRAFHRLFGEGLGASALALVQWVPTMEFMGRSVRAHWNSSYGAAYSLWPGALAAWVLPNALGNPLDATFADVPSVFFETCGAGAGAAALVLALLGLRANPFAGVLVGAGLFLGAGGHNPLYRWLIEATPLGFLRTPSRYAFLCLWGLLLACGGGLRRLGARRPALWGLLAALAVCLELVPWDLRFLKSESNARYLAFHETFADVLGGKPARVVTDPDSASANKAMLYRAMNVNGYEAFYLAGFPEFAAASEGKAAADASRSYLRRYDAPMMARAGVNFFLAANGVILSNPKARGLAWFAGGAAPEPAVSLDWPERWSVRGRTPRGAGPEVLALALPYYPGWSARLGGKSLEVFRQGGFFSWVELPEAARGADFELTLRFKPTGWPLWPAASALAWVGLLFFWRRSLPA